MRNFILSVVAIAMTASVSKAEAALPESIVVDGRVCHLTYVDGKPLYNGDIKQIPTASRTTTALPVIQSFPTAIPSPCANGNCPNPARSTRSNPFR